VDWSDAYVVVCSVIVLSPAISLRWRGNHGCVLRPGAVSAGEELDQHGREGCRRDGVVLTFQRAVSCIGEIDYQRFRLVVEKRLALLAGYHERE
jgi:hypothetical protein